MNEFECNKESMAEYAEGRGGKSDWGELRRVEESWEYCSVLYEVLGKGSGSGSISCTDDTG
jgi:hypothetical protein